MLRPVPPSGPDTCLHCAVADLYDEQFGHQDADLSISQLLELIGDWIDSIPDLEVKMKLMQFAELTMMRNRNDILAGRWKKEK